jgi:phosphoglycolate phosphatase-like HAD superfamily hydrolase
MKKVVRTALIVAMLAAVIVGYFYYLSNRKLSKISSGNKTVSEYAKIKNHDFDKAYPESPRSVVKWYNRIITEYYANDHTDNEIKELASQARKLFDDELLKANPEDQFFDSVKSDIADYKKRKAKIVTSKVESSNDVEYATYQGSDVAYVQAYYFSKEGSEYVRTYQDFCLRKTDGKWKILTWKVVDGDPDKFD